MFPAARICTPILVEAQRPSVEAQRPKGPNGGTVDGSEILLTS